MAFEKILFIPTEADLDQPGARALLAMAAPETQIEVFEPVYSVDLQEYSTIDGETYEKARDELVERRLKRIAGLAADLQGRGLKCTTTAAWDHPVHEAIIRRALSTQADLVITEPIEGRAGALANGDWRLASRCPVPLLLVRSDSAGDYDRIVAAVDPWHTHAKPEELDASIIRYAGDVQRLTGGALQVVHCFAPVTEIVPAPYSEHLPIDDAETALESFRRKALNELVEEAGLAADSARLIKGKPSAALRALIEGGEASLLVMGALSRGRIRDFVLGNTAEHILYHTETDVLLVKPPGFETTVAEKMPEDLLTRPLYFPF